MDLRKTLISVLWILLLNEVKDYNAEEGMWKKINGSVVPKLATAALIRRQMSAVKIV